MSSARQTPSGARANREARARSCSRPFGGPPNASGLARLRCRAIWTLEECLPPLRFARTSGEQNSAYGPSEPHFFSRAESHSRRVSCSGGPCRRAMPPPPQLLTHAPVAVPLPSAPQRRGRSSRSAAWRLFRDGLGRGQTGVALARPTLRTRVHLKAGERSRGAVPRFEEDRPLTRDRAPTEWKHLSLCLLCAAQPHRHADIHPCT